MYINDTGWTLSDGQPLNLDIDQGDAFIVNGGDFFLDSVELAVGLVFGQNRIFIVVYTTVGGLPGVVIDSAVIDGQMSIFVQANPPIVALFDGSTTLFAGEQYFVTASTDSDTWAAWNLNSVGDFGPHASREGLGDWNVNDELHGAFRVNGTPVTAPGAFALLGVAGLAVRRRRRTV